MKKLTLATALAVSALLMPFGAATALASRSNSLEIDFNKCYVHDGDYPYVVTFAGRTSGDASGKFEARILTYTVGVGENQNFIEADYVLAGSLPFTARVGGRENSRTDLAVLRGYVSAGPAWLVGAGVLDEFKNYVKPDGTPCSKGTLYITPRWKQTENDEE